VVATVMGTDRIAYDVFGDTVNTSSRCMSTAQEWTMQSPLSMQHLYQPPGADGAQPEPTGALHNVFMKGKGDVAVLRS
jgi:hypothetical protein